MDDTVIHALRLYLDDAINFDSLEDCIIPIAFEAQAEDGGLVFQMVAEVAYAKARVLDEATFRQRVAEALERQQDDGVRVVAS